MSLFHKLKSVYRVLFKNWETVPSSGTLKFLDQLRTQLPAKIDFEVFNQEETKYLRRFVEQNVGTAHSLDAEELCYHLMRLVSGHVKIGPIKELRSPKELLESGEASCGGFAMLFSDLTKVFGLPSRYLGVFGLLNAGSHALTEVYYNNRWHLYDPTFGTCFMDLKRPLNDQVMSATQVFTSEDRHTLVKVYQNPWDAEYFPAKEVNWMRVGQDENFPVWNYWNEENRKRAFPIAYGNEAAVSFPVIADLGQQAPLQVGVINNNWYDVYESYYKNINTGYWYLGGVCPTSYHFLQIKNADLRSRVRITYHFVEGGEGELCCFPLSNAILSECKQSDKKAVLELMVLENQSNLLVWSNGLKYIDSLEIRCV